MPDTTVLPTGGTTGGSSGPNWLLIGGAGVSILLVVYFLSKQGSAGQPTVAAGSSINAALGSIQEQNLNVLGEVSKTGQTLTNELGAVNSNIIVGNQMSTWVQNQVAWAAAEQATNPTDAAQRLQMAFNVWLNQMQGGGANGGDTTPGGYTTFPVA